MKKTILLIVIMLQCTVAFSQKRAPSCWLNYKDYFRGDIIVNTVRVQAPSPTYTYYCTMQWNAGREGGGYCGMQEHPTARNFIFSIWDPRASNEPITASHTHPGTKIQNFGGEGTGLKSWNFDIGWETGQWYSLVSRTWSKNNHTMFGFWVFNQTDNIWYHLVTMDYPVDNVRFDTGTGSFIEDWVGSGQNVREIHHKNGWKRNTNDLTWKAFDRSYFKRVKPDPGANNYIDNYDGGVRDDYYFMTSGGTTTPVTTSSGTNISLANSNVNPNFSKGDITSFGVNLNVDNLDINWSVDKSKSPQFSYHIKIYDNPSFSGKPLIDKSVATPHMRKESIDTSSLPNNKNYYVNFEITDIFDNKSTPKTISFTKGVVDICLNNPLNNQKVSPVEFTTSKVDVWCFDGYDGSISLSASGGVSEEDSTAFYEYKIIDTDPVNGDFSKDWTAFSGKKTHTISSLPKGIYKIKVRDSNACVAKEQKQLGSVIELGKEIEETIEIKEPESSLLVEETFRKDPTANGWVDGKITFKVTGGTIKADDSYNFELHESTPKGTLMKVFKTTFNKNSPTTSKDDEYYITFFNLKATDYFLTIKDKNYASATDLVDPNKDNIGSCGYINQKFTIDEPEKIKAKIDVIQPIFCNDDNAHNSEEDFNGNGIVDEYETGALKITVKGGTPFTGTTNNGLPYIYNWKYKAPNTKVWKPVHQVGQSFLTDEIKTLPYGDYAINIIDAHGVMLGDYKIVVNPDGTNSIVIDKEKDILFYLKEPDVLKVNLTSVDVTCSSGTNGQVSAIVSGGVPFDDGTYKYEWSTGDTTSSIKNLVAGTYFVFVKDKMGCRTQGKIIIEQPEKISIDVLKEKAPTCNLGKDGEISVKATGGVSPYKFHWNTNSTTNSITNLPSGDYNVLIEDAKGCSSMKNFKLTEPKPITVNLGNDRTLCLNQSHELDITIKDKSAKYNWTKDRSQFSNNSIVKLTKPGVYTASVESSKGCSGIDEIEITLSEEIKPKFIISSQAFVGEKVVLVNVSSPEPESVEWKVPKGVDIIDKKVGYLEVVFPKEGSYEIELKGIQGDCYSSYNKKILVHVKADSSNSCDIKIPFIEEFKVAPNPNKGTFKAYVKLKEKSPISLNIFNILGRKVLKTVKTQGKKAYTIPYTFRVSGVYIIVLETPKERAVKKIVIL